MPSVHFQSVSFAYTSAVEVLSDVDLHLGPGWVGMVGPNGAGKSTLLRLIAGQLPPTEGQVMVDALVPPVLCPQRVENLEPAIEGFAQTWDPEDVRLRGRLALDPEQLSRWESLSHGERKRWQVGAALAARPDVLLLDEPTNHLDAHARGLLVAALERFRGVGLVVSHDRHLLDSITGATIRVDRGRAELWAGGYSSAKKEWQEAEASQVAAYQELRKEQKRLERRLADQRREVEQRAGSFRKSVRTSGSQDHDARGMLRKGRANAGEAAAARRMSVAREQAARLAEDAAGFDLRKPKGRRVAFRYDRAPRATLLHYRGPIEAGGRALVPWLEVLVGRHDRIHLCGPNGAGKTTLLEALAARWDLPSDRLLHLPQELTATDAINLLGRVRRLPSERQGRVMQLVAALGVDPEPLLVSDLPSPGEARKLKLALGLGLDAWCLLLDEPTNHLDLPAVERLESALTDFPGALVLVTHYASFAEEVTETSWRLEGGRLQIG
ncbi:MAG: ATP-binding cassette domain-containing protein [Actinomycetota bacterium]|nr:ATP-binding cassette domain-containing protein [Actinomycetota bacterium]